VFDIGFFELLVIGCISLVVIGPERLPEAARAVGLWLGRLKRSLRETRTELEKQLGADDIRRQLHNEEVMRSLESSKNQIQEAVQDGLIERPKRQYKAEEERPDHAHTHEATAPGPARDTARVEPPHSGEDADGTEARPEPPKDAGSTDDNPSDTQNKTSS